MDGVNKIANGKRAFIFDMDGTLVDNMKFHSQAWLALFSSLGISLDSEKFLRATAGKTNPEILRQFTGRNLTDKEVKVLSDQKENFYRSLYQPHLKATKGLMPFLEKAKNLNIPMGLATAAGQENIDFILHNLGIQKYFKAIVGAEDIQKGKPDPDIFFRSARKLQAQPEDCIVFEDSLLGIQAARQAGMRAVFIATSHKPEELGIQPALLLAVNDFSTLDVENFL